MDIRIGQEQPDNESELVAGHGLDGAFEPNGVDFVLVRLFGDKREGFYVDVGAHHPHRRSSTYRLRQMGWSGINVCTSAESAGALGKERPHDVSVTLAIGNGALPTHRNGGAAKSNGHHASEPNGHAAGDSAASMRSLDDVLRGHMPPGRPIDLFNVEASGAGLSVLMSNDWSRFRSAVLTVEDADLMRNGVSPIRTFAEAQGYRLVGHIFDSSIYALPDLLEPAGFFRSFTLASFPSAIVDATGKAVSAVVNSVGFAHSRFNGHPGALKAAHHSLHVAQTDLLRRQLAALSAEHDDLVSSAAWRIAKPIHAIERKISQLLDRPSPEVPRHVVPPGTPSAAAKKAYYESPIAAEPDSFVLYRIIGNDLRPRHRSGQSRDNVAFILAHEPELESCEKRWVINRITSPGAEAEIIDLLERHRQRYIRIPFDLEEYARIDWALEDFPSPGFFMSQRFLDLDERAKVRAEQHVRWRKNAYVMNNNGARNAALADGRGAAKWILPWDGNCFVSADAWRDVRAAVVERPYLPYFVVPMARIPDNARLLDGRHRGPAKEEPQIIFRKDAREAFDERFVYGRRPKVELLYRLAVPGPWDRWWHFDPWDALPGPLATEAGQFATAGWVARLNSGMPELEVGTGSSGLRGDARIEAIAATIDRLDIRILARKLNPDRLSYYDDAALDSLATKRATEPLADRLRRDADEALTRGPYSVVDKTTLPPSGDPRDYWHIAPNYWPNPDTPDGLPYVPREGERVAETELYAAGSDRFDRTRLQRMFDDTTVLALAWRVHGEERYAEHAAKLIRRWFVDHDTRMNPHLQYARVRRGHDGDVGHASGIIEFKDVCYLLDAVRLLAQEGALSEFEIAAFRSWMRTYLLWLETSDSGLEEARKSSHHGTMLDLQVAAIGTYVRKLPVVTQALRRAHERMLVQFNAAGAQPRELRHTDTLHRCCFNLQGWVTLAQIAASCGDDLWSHATSDGRGIGGALEWFIRGASDGDWPFPEIDPFDGDRLLPLVRDFHRHYRNSSKTQADRFAGRAIYHPTTGIAPYWMLARD